MNAMSNVQITITPNANGSLIDDLGIDAATKDATFIGVSLVAGRPVTVTVPGAMWTRIRAKLSELSQRRIAAYDPVTLLPLGNGRTMPYITYTATPAPGGRPRIHQVEGGTISLAAPGNVTLRGSGFLGSVFASASIKVGGLSNGAVDILPGTTIVPRATEVFRVTSLLAGPQGNYIRVRLLNASGAGAVTVKREVYQGQAYFVIEVVPAAGASNTTAIAAQIAGNAVAAALVTATAVVASIPLSPTQFNVNLGKSSGAPELTASKVQQNALTLAGGDGSGPSSIHIPVVEGVMTNRLVFTANRAGNDTNLITLTLNMSQGANTVVVTGNDIVVNRTAATETLANLVTAINANANAAALGTASAVGSGSLGATAKTWAWGGAGDGVVATIGGAAARVVSMTDTSMVLATTNAALVAAGAVAGEQMIVQVSLSFGQISASAGALGA